MNSVGWNNAWGAFNRYKQQHNVLILNLVADETREGKVLKVLLEKLENIRDELGDNSMSSASSFKMFRSPT